MEKIKNFKVGDKCQYNKKYSQSEVVEILQILDRHCLVLFPSGYKLCTTLSGLYPLQNGN
jgi:hypothetical protein